MPVTWIPGEGFYANAYICGNVLVDAGALPMAVAEYKEQIEFIVLTHTHFDHIKYLKELSAMCGAEVCVHRQDAAGLVDDRQSLALQFGERSPMVVPDRVLNDGDEVGGLRVIHTPGHTAGSICLYDPTEKVLFSGDTVFSDGNVGRCDSPGGDCRAISESVRRLSELEVRAIYPGHGMPCDEGGDAVIAAAGRYTGLI